MMEIVSETAWVGEAVNVEWPILAFVFVVCIFGLIYTAALIMANKEDKEK